MSNTDVGLDVRNFPSTGKDGYTDTTASNSAVYSYKYSGGSDGNGNMVETADGVTGTITITLHSDPRYQATGVLISGDIEDQLSWAMAPNSTTSVIITDKDTACGSGYYSVVVSDTSAKCTFGCDPAITNVPKVN